MIGYKSELRKIMKSKREELIIGQKEKYDQEIYDKVIANPIYLKSKVIFVFVSYDNEVDTHEIIKHALSNNKIVCVPKIISKVVGMVAVEIKSFDELTPGAYGILEPSSNSECAIDPEKIDMVLLPGLAFDKFGGRLGYGGGFYDRYLAKIRRDTKKIGIGYNFQLIDKVPTCDYDMPIDDVITN